VDEGRLVRAAALVLALVVLAPPALADGYRSCCARSNQVRRGMTSSTSSGAAASSGVPNKIVAWWDASDSASITQSSNAISAWVDEIGGFSAAVSVAGDKPTLVASGSGTLGGAQHVSFDGGDYLLVSSTVGAGSLGEVWMTIDVDDVTAGTRTCFCENNSANNTAYCGLRSNGAPTNQAKGSIINSNGTNDVTATTTSHVNNTSYVVQLGSSDTAYFGSVNGTSQTMTMATGSNNGNWFADVTLNQTAIGAFVGLSELQDWTGQLRDVLVVDGANLSAADVLLVRCVLSHGVGVTFP
jgi:hypothetical protein